MFLGAGAARLQEADILRANLRSVGAIYLAGYAVECVLKALILALVDEHEQRQIIAQFRGNKAHDFGWLRMLYRENGGANFPKEVVDAFTIVNAWRVDLRYNPRKEYPGDTRAFFRAVDVVLKWADERV
jgi:hypothetical protein